MKKWKIWFDQVNQTVYEVEARTKDSAIFKAQREWTNDFNDPYPSYVEEQSRRKIGKSKGT